jgi:hypothetical protein
MCLAAPSWCRRSKLTFAAPFSAARSPDESGLHYSVHAGRAPRPGRSRGSTKSTKAAGARERTKPARRRGARLALSSRHSSQRSGESKPRRREPRAPPGADFTDRGQPFRSIVITCFVSGARTRGSSEPSAFQMRAVLSREPVTTRRPSGLKDYRSDRMAGARAGRRPAATRPRR